MRNIDLYGNIRHFLIASFIFWLVLGAVDLARDYYFAINWNENFEWPYRITWTVSYQFSTWIVTYLVFLFFRKHLKKTIRIQAWYHSGFMVFTSFFALGISFFTSTSIRFLLGIVPEDAVFMNLILNQINIAYPLLFSGLIRYIFILAILMALHYYHKYRNESIHSAKLETQLSQTQLRSLRMQLHPHFLFNALNTVSMLIRQKKDVEAIETISGISEMLRSSLSENNKHLVPLSEELEMINKYLKIEQIRFKDKLHIHFETEPESKQVKVPNLILQPIVENAFKHGISHELEDSFIEIKTRIKSKRLCISVFNTGPGISESFNIEKQSGIGLKNINVLI
jgi:sensor histidine kinase YesM